MNASSLATAALFAALALLAGCSGATPGIRTQPAPDVRTVDSLFAAYAGRASPTTARRPASPTPS